MRHVTENGFSLLEALIAAGLFAAAMGTLVHLVMRSSEQTVRTELATVSLTLAEAKLENLRGALFDYDAAGAPVDDASVSITPATSHDQDSPPFLERLDRFGQIVPPESAAAYIRRWSIAPVNGDLNTRMFTVCVAAAGSFASALRPSCVWTIRTRQP